MVHSLRGMVFAVGFVAVAGAYAMIDRGLNYEPAKASVFLIERTCKFDRQHPDGKRETVTQPCGSTEEFRQIARSARRKMDVDGKAVVKISYTAPRDGSAQTSQLRFDGRDDEFYKLKAGDTIDVLVSNDDPAIVIKG